MQTKRKIVFAPLIAKAAAIRVLQDIVASKERPTGPQLRARVRESSPEGHMIADNKWVLGRIVNDLGFRLDQIASTAVFESRRTPKIRTEPAPDRMEAIERTLGEISRRLNRIASELGVADV